MSDKKKKEEQPDPHEDQHRQVFVNDLNGACNYTANITEFIMNMQNHPLIKKAEDEAALAVFFLQKASEGAQFKPTVGRKIKLLEVQETWQKLQLLKNHADAAGQMLRAIVQRIELTRETMWISGDISTASEHMMRASFWLDKAMSYYRRKTITLN